MIEDFIYAGFRFKVQELNQNEYLVFMLKENQSVEKFIVPKQSNIADYIENYLNIFYFSQASNTTRKYKNS